MYYYRNLDPDNNIVLSGDYTTQNTIISQNMLCSACPTRVSASQTFPWNSYFEFLAIDSNWVAGYGGFTNRDASDMFTGVGFTQTVGATNFADEAIYLSHKIDSLPAGGTQSFKFCSLFAASAAADAIASLQASEAASVNDLGVLDNNVSVYPNPLTDNATVNIASAVVLNNASLHVYDLLGKEVKEITNIQTHTFTFERAGLSPGMYIYKLENNGKGNSVGRIIIK